MKNATITVRDIIARLSTHLNALDPANKPRRKTAFNARAASSVSNGIFSAVRATLATAKLTGDQPNLDYLEMTKKAKKAQ